MHWEKLRTPVFWAITIWISFALYSVASVFLELRNSPYDSYTKGENLYFQNLVFAFLLLVPSTWGVLTITWLRKSSQGEILLLDRVSILCSVFGIFQIIIGTIGLNFLVNLYSILPKIPSDIPLRSLVITSTTNNALQLPVGGLVLYFSLLQLLKNKMMQRKA